MRIISGQWRGRRLISPANNKTRPTSDRVKESIFNILQHDIYNAEVLDCFSGTGNLGYEALSRGARHACLIEKDHLAKKIIMENCLLLKAEECSTIIQGDFFIVMSQLSKNDKKFDLIFVDPPYGQGLQEKTLAYLSTSNSISDQTMVVVEHQSQTVLPQSVGKLKQKQCRKYGRTSVSFYAL